MNRAINGPATDRLARFKSRPEVEAVARKYADYVETDAGIKTNLMLALFGYARASGKMTRRQYRNALDELARECRLPLADLEIMAECHLELIKCALISTGQRLGASSSRRSRG